ncbi:MAG: hypothetical protein FK730_13000 [Asgard group archaeon]|nr:hypothetical protein [Asgard group archaeon]
MKESEMEKELREIEAEEEILSNCDEESLEYQFVEFNRRNKSFTQNTRTLIIFLILIGLTQTGLLIGILYILIWIKDYLPFI